MEMLKRTTNPDTITGHGICVEIAGCEVVIVTPTRESMTLVYECIYPGERLLERKTGKVKVLKG